MILPGHERPLPPIRTDRFRGEQLVERQRAVDPSGIRAGPKERPGGLLGISPEQQVDLPRLGEIMLVSFDVVLGQGERERRVRVVPADEVRILLLELFLDAVPQPRDDIARAVAVDRLVEP